MRESAVPFRLFVSIRVCIFPPTDAFFFIRKKERKPFFFSRSVDGWVEEGGFIDFSCLFEKPCDADAARDATDHLQVVIPLPP